MVGVRSLLNGAFSCRPVALRESQPSRITEAVTSTSDREIVFKPWRPFVGRSSPRVDPAWGGVYLWAYCASGEPPEIPTPDTLPFEVIYIGVAKDLNKRPLTGQHGAVEKFQNLFHRDSSSLIVSFAPLFPAGCADEHVERAFACHIEALLVWKYTDRHKHPPILHSKKKKGKPHSDWVMAALDKHLSVAS